jgi:hypothetical protein
MASSSTLNSPDNTPRKQCILTPPYHIVIFPYPDSQLGIGTGRGTDRYGCGLFSLIHVVAILDLEIQCHTHVIPAMGLVPT